MNYSQNLLQKVILKFSNIIISTFITMYYYTHFTIWILIKLLQENVAGMKFNPEKLKKFHDEIQQNGLVKT